LSSDRLSGGTPSIQRRLTVTLVAIVGVSLVACSLTVYVKFTQGVWRDFDARLVQDAHAIALMVEEYGDRPWEIEPGGFEAFKQMRGPASVEIWMDDGSVLWRAPGSVDLPFPAKAAGPTFSDVTLRDGRPGRICQAWLPPRQGHEGGVHQAASGRRIGIAVARQIDEPLATIAGFRVLLWAPTLGVILVAALAASLSIRTMLGHVKKISEGIAALDASSPGDRLLLRGVPDELRPPFVKLNELLSRIEASRVRERQFNADVSHELRTPLAGLRSILEVSASRGRSAAEYRVTLGEALAVVRQMETIVENLLMLARLGSGQMTVEREEIALGQLVDSCYAPYAEAARQRGLRFDNHVPPSLIVWSDPHRLRLVLANLLSNAAEYTAEGGSIAVESHPERGVVVTVRDSGPSIPRGAVARLFDPFFRLDPSRSASGEHCGIGLTLVRALCDALGYGVEARNEVGGGVSFTVSAEASSIGFQPSRTHASSSFEEREERREASRTVS